MEFNRRDFIKGTLALGSIAAVGGLAGCSSPQNQSPDSSPLADTGSIPGIPESFTDGKWIGTAMGHDDDLIVEVVVAGGDLASVRVLRCDDTIGIGTTAAPIMAARILETKNLDVDTVTGATTTSIAVRNAVADAITNAGGSVSSFSLGTTAPTGGAPQNLEVDVALAGAGTAGLIAAVRLLEAGKSVVLFEKQDIAGGSMPMTYSGVAAAESQLQSNYALGRHDENPMFNKAGMLAVMSKYLVPENDRFDGAMPYQTAMYDNSGKLVDWLHGMGVGFYSLGVNPAYGVTPYLAPGCYMGGCGYAKDFLVDRVGALGRPDHLRHRGHRTRPGSRRPSDWSFGPGPQRLKLDRGCESRLPHHGRIRSQPGYDRRVLPRIRRLQVQLRARIHGRGYPHGAEGRGRHRVHGARARRLPLDDEPGRL